MKWQSVISNSAHRKKMPWHILFCYDDMKKDCTKISTKSYKKTIALFF